MFGLDPEYYDTAIGSGFAIVSNIAWESIVAGGDPVPGVEHHHWGLLSLLLASRYPELRYALLGFGGSLIVQKLASPDPLGLKDTPEQRELNYGLTSLLAGLNVAAWSS